MPEQATGAMSGSQEAHDIYVRQVKYDRLHHQMRLQWLESLPRLSHFEHRLLTQSRSILADPTGMHGYHSVDVDDAEYVAELDAFAIAKAEATQ